MSLSGCERHDLDVAHFDRRFFNGDQRFTRIGTGSIGGKAAGLAMMQSALKEHTAAFCPSDITVEIPTLTVIAAHHFEHFMEANNLQDLAFSDAPDYRIAHSFQKTELPADLVGDLRALIAQVHSPLAVRSSSYLEDAMFQPFASVYTTKMIPNNQTSADIRFDKLVEAVKFIYASTFFHAAKNYIRATAHTTADERMAVIIQEIVGCRHQDRFYPHISGVARSYNYYPFGPAKPEDGVIDLALGLGRAIVDDGMGWSYAPPYPTIGPPFKSVGDLLDQSQTEYWAVHMGAPPPYDPIHEAEYMCRCNLATAESDGTLDYLVSTYDAANDRMQVGMHLRGPRVLNFAPILEFEQIPLNDVLRGLLQLGEQQAGTPVEIEFAVTLDPHHGRPARIGFLQMRPMVVPVDEVEVAEDDIWAPEMLLGSNQIMGNGRVGGMRDIVYVKPETWSPLKTWIMATQLEGLNRRLLEESRPYLLIGLGRWGTTDPSLGIPVNFGQISGARAIVEATLPGMYVNFSQGSHFFHNMTSFRIVYFFAAENSGAPIDWDWLSSQDTVEETEFIRWVRVASPLDVIVDGRRGRGVIRR